MEMMSQICRKVFNQKSKINIRDYILESFSSILFSEVSMKENYCREQSIENGYISMYHEMKIDDSKIKIISNVSLFIIT